MQVANILLAIGGEKDNTVPKFGITPAEVAVLRVIHGDDSVTEIQPTGDIERRNREERQRLVEVYGRRVDGTRHAAPAVDALFPGAAARVFETFEELEMDSSFYAATGRVSAGSTSARPAAPVAEPAGLPNFKAMKVAELVEFANVNRIDLSGKTKKADVLAIIEAATAAPAPQAEEPDEAHADEDGIGDMDDGQGGASLFK